MPRVAIAMPVYNDERYLPLALEALCAQTFRDFHLTVYDDGSSDRSASVVESYAGRIPVRVIRGAHGGMAHAKFTAWAEAAPAPYLLALDSDMALPPDALERMVAPLDADPSVAAVSARPLSFRGRRLGPSQRFVERFFFAVTAGADGNGRLVVGGCMMLRRSAIEGIAVRADVSDDIDLSQKLRDRWRLLAPEDLVADHYGVPTTVKGVLRRYEREGIRVKCLLRAYPGARQLGHLARLVPLPLLALAAGGALAGSAWIAGAGAAALAGYLGALLLASRKVPAALSERLGGALLFTLGNVGFGWGYLREALRGGGAVIHEPERRF